MTKKILVAVAAVAALSVAIVVPGAHAAGPAGCQLDGTATFDNPLKAPNAANFSYSFTGALTNCQNGSSKTGTVFAGTHGLNHPTGNGSCISSTTAGESVVQWSDGGVTVISYKTTGAAAAVALQGTVVKATTETNSTGQPLYTTNEASTPVGANAGGALAFQPPDPTACNGAGVTQAGIHGVIGTN